MVEVQIGKGGSVNWGRVNAGLGPRSITLRSLLLVASLLCAAMLSAALAPSASAVSIGVNWSGYAMESVGKSGATLVRVEVTPAKSSNGANWTYYDEAFGSAAVNGVTVLPLINGRLNGGSGLPSSGEKAEYEEWLKKAVRRYGYNGVYWSSNPGVPARPAYAWEVWNEPNNANFGSITGSDYGKFLAWAGPAIQAASESWGGQKTEVLFGGLLSWSGGINYQMFLKNAYEVTGAPSAFTGFAFHPYALDTSTFPPGKSRIDVFKEAVNASRSYLNSLPGGSGKSLWITEVGWPAEAQYGVGDSEQASLLSESFGWAKTQAGLLNLQAIAWYVHRDLGGAEIWQNRCGLQRSNGSYRAAWYAFQSAAGVPAWPIPGPELEVAYADGGNGNSASGWQFGSGTGWQQMFLWGHEVAAGTEPVVLRYEESTHIFFVDANRENRITEWSWNPVTGWQQNFLATNPVMAGSSPAGVLVGSEPRLFFADAANGNTITIFRKAAGKWEQTPLGGDPVAANSSPSAIWNGSSTQIFFVDAAKGDTIAAWVWGPSAINLSRFYGDPVAENSSPSAIVAPGSVQVYFANAAKGNTISGWIWNSALAQVDLYGNPVAKDSSPSAINSGGTSEIFFADAANSNAITVWIWNSGLVQVPLGGDSVAAGSSPEATTNGGSPQIYFSSENANRSIAYWEWTPTTLKQTRLYGHPVAAGSSPGATP